MEGGGQYNAGEADVFFGFVVGCGWVTFIALLIAVIYSTIAIFFYAGNQKSKAASIMMIITSVIIAIGTMFIGFLLVAGIVGLARKPPVNPQVVEP